MSIYINKDDNNNTYEISGTYTSIANDNTQIATSGADLILISVANSVY